MEVNFDGVKCKAYFQVIKITNDTKLYPALLGIDGAFENLVVLDINKRQMSFDFEDLRVVVPLDPNEGDQYNKLGREISTIETLTSSTTL